MSLDGNKIVCQNYDENVRGVFVINEEEGLHPVGEMEMDLKIQTLIPNDKIVFLTYHMDPSMIIQSSKPPYKTLFFKPGSKKIISLLKKQVNLMLALTNL